MSRPRVTRPAMAIAAIALAGIAALHVPWTVTAQADGSRACSERTLRGDYGIVVSGVAGAGPGVTESFVGAGVRTYDGEGGFTQIDNRHGSVTGVVLNAAASGIYHFNPDCTGSSTGCGDRAAAQPCDGCGEAHRTVKLESRTG